MFFLTPKNLIIVSLLTTTVFAQSASDFQKQQLYGFEKEKTKFDIYKKDIQQEFKEYQKAQEKTYNEYKKELGFFWEKPKLSTKKTWVSYSKDKKTRSDVDFENETITIQTIADSEQEAKKKLQVTLAKVVTQDTKSAQENDELEIKLAKIKKPANMVTAKIEPEPILSTVIFDKEPTKDKVVAYVKNTIQYNKINSTKSTKVRHAKVYSIYVKMPKHAMIKRSKLYYEEVKKQANRQKLPIPLIFAIMHSESSFNPRARSHIPAYGLMQIVPTSAGIDTYKYLYKKRKVVSGSYLYNSKNNITMGSGYLHILYYKYLSKIKNPDSRLYCTIAAYNTGAGNVAWAFNRNKDLTYRKKLLVSNAADDINKLSPDEVYNRLLRDLRYDEPKHYLKRVSKRMGAYHKVYGL